VFVLYTTERLSRLSPSFQCFYAIGVFWCLLIVVIFTVKYCNEYVCLSALTHRQTLSHVAHGCGLVVLWWLCDTLCTSSFVDSVILYKSFVYL